jgi:hypothetical protein
MKRMSVSPFDWKMAVRSIVHSYSVGFVALDRSGMVGSRPVGSGTLVEFSGIRGVVTAAHVAEYICGMQEVGLLLFSPGKTAEALSLKGEVLDATYVRGPSYGPEGPDLAFLRLPQEVEDRVAATKAFFNSAVRWHRPQGRNDQEQLFVLTGLLAEAAIDHGIVGGSHKSEQSAIIATGRLADHRKDQSGVDLLDFHRDQDPDNPPPDSYGGVSGGGLWRVRDEELGNTLIGVAYYENEADQTGHRVIKCHWPLSVHEVLYLAVLDKYDPEQAAAHRAAEAHLSSGSQPDDKNVGADPG